MILVIDNYDSFTYNLVQYLQEMEADVRVFRNDEITISEIERLNPTHIVISPGPGDPTEAGISVEVIQRLAGTRPILGVCLGHQSLGYAFGGKVVRAKKPMHGKISPILHDGKKLFSHLPKPFDATRYHSLLVEKSSLPSCFTISAWTQEGEIMGLRHKTIPALEGVQFHPESILTTHGKKLLANFLTLKIKREGETLMAFGFQDALNVLLARKALTRDQVRDVFSQLMAGKLTAVQIAALLTALRIKGETVEEIAGAAEAMRDAALPVSFNAEAVVDTCGTGGDGQGTFNISTAAAFVVAGAGFVVAKHGNRSFSSRCGSADVLEELGLHIESDPRLVELCLAKVGIAFLYAPLFHPAMKHAMPVRKELGVRTIFNLLGPLTNPIRPTVQVIGVYDPAWLNPVAKVLVQLGCKNGYVVHGEGHDEIILSGPTQVAEIRDGRVHMLTWNPKNFGLTTRNESLLAGGTAVKHAQVMMKVLEGKPSPIRDAVCMNAAAAILAAARQLNSAGPGLDLKDAFAIAQNSIEDGKALAKFNNLKDTLNAAKPHA